MPGGGGSRGLSMTPGRSVAMRTASTSVRNSGSGALSLACLGRRLDFDFSGHAGRSRNGIADSRKCFQVPFDRFPHIDAPRLPSVLPVVIHPGKSGTYAAQLLSACSKMTAYLTLIAFFSSPAAFRIDFSVPAGTSSPGCPGIVTSSASTGACSAGDFRLFERAAIHRLPRFSSGPEPSPDPIVEAAAESL